MLDLPVHTSLNLQVLLLEMFGEMSGEMHHLVQRIQKQDLILVVLVMLQLILMEGTIF